MQNPQACIFLHGRFPKSSLIRKIVSRSDLLICADGAANDLKKLRITPHVIIGDLDSIRPSVLHYYRSKTQIIKLTDQNSTDFEKILAYCKEKGVKQAWILGFSSEMGDHTLSNYQVMKRYNKNISLSMLDDYFVVSFVQKKAVFPYRVGEIVSLLPFPRARGVVTKGLKYPLRAENLSLGVRDGVRNQATASRVSVELKSGDLLLFRRHFIK